MVQVRFASSRATRELLQGVPDACCEALLPVLLPAMCLNRYYVAEGVRVFSQESWKLVFGTTGRRRVAEQIAPVVVYYVSQSKVTPPAPPLLSFSESVEVCAYTSAPV